ncbi:Gfo/Idh/MocA family protein [Wenjunlia tyrosinilytica]|jgi:myo-inositol 2-dehydrogenase/D-chiro-inositol 1-dehydrogenase|uniref:Dehydrogenase n=1 Tax=Wenjunlia tyrosinilytica TaxID=1544741 RepID=A0A917ZTF7_9ACTN|nr:Gfo/Idh/MocA family oxidoreductase [Wenjunlia tyrosinilytica]GGO92561.1 dehydrogenase [Wenjunlia tyrosinilytica]
MRIGLLGAGRIGAFHAAALSGTAGVGELVVADVDQDRAAAVAEQTGSRAAQSVDEVFAAGVDAVVISTATASHAELIVRAARAGLPVYCEKPISLDLHGTVAALREVREAGTVLQMGFQRRFDAGYRAAREAVLAGSLGRLHTVRAMTSDPAPPPAAYVPLSGGLYRDCLVHDFDIIRWVTGREVTEVFATGTAGGADFFRAAGDVDTAAALLTLDDGTLATATATRYNGAGYDVRMELAGSDDQIAVGVDARTPITSVEPGSAPCVPHPWTGFLDRFDPAYRAELATFVQVAAGRAENPCSGEEALRALQVAEACELSRRERRPVALAEIEALTAEVEAAKETVA